MQSIVWTTFVENCILAMMSRVAASKIFWNLENETTYKA